MHYNRYGYICQRNGYVTVQPKCINYLFMFYDLNTVSGRFEWRLKNTGLIQADLARILNINPQRITHWIRRNSIPKGKLFDVCKVLNCRPVWLEKGELPIDPLTYHLDFTQSPAIMCLANAIDKGELAEEDAEALVVIAERMKQPQAKEKQRDNIIKPEKDRPPGH